MPFPTVLSVTETTFAVEATAHVANLPATVSPNDLLVALFTGTDTGGGSPTSTLSGWTEIMQSADTFTLHSAYTLDAAGTEDGTTIDIVTNVSCAGAVYVLRIQAGTWGGTQATALEAATPVTGSGSGADPDPPNLAPSWGSFDTLWIALGHVNDDAAGTVTSVGAAPSGYANLDSFTYTSASVEAAEMVAYKTATLSSDNPGTFTVTNSGSMFWMGSTLAVKGVPQGGGYLVHEADGTSRYTLEDSSGFLILEETADVVDATATPATVNVVAAVPSATKTASADKAAVTVNTVVGVPVPVTIGGTTATPATVTLITAVPAVTKTASVEKAATTVNAPAAVPAVTKIASVEKAAAPVNAVVGVPLPTLTASVQKLATTVNLAASVPASTRTASVEKNATTVNLAALIPAVTKTASVEKTAVTVNAVAFVPQAAASGSGEATVLPVPVTALTGIPLAVVSASTTKTATTVTLLAAVPAVTKTASVQLVLVTVNVVVGVPTVTVIGGLAQFYDMSSGEAAGTGYEPGSNSVGVEQDSTDLAGVESGGLLVGVEGG